MPYSLVLELYSTGTTGDRAAPITGEHLQAAFLSLVSQADSQLAAELHDGNRLRAYSVGLLRPLLHARAQGTHHPRVDMRIACLNDRVYPPLMRSLLDAEGRAEVRLGSRPAFTVVRLLATPESGNAWSRYDAVNDLLTRASRSEHFITLRFVSPTTFGQGSREESLPAPELVFSGLARRWNAAYGEKLLIPEAEFNHQVREHVVAAGYRMESAQIPVGNDPRGGSLRQTGCVGTVSYRVTGRPDEAFVHLLNLLADAAIFSGVGKKTSRGGGMVRREK